MLVDSQIKELCRKGMVQNYSEENIQPVSLDVRLSNVFSRFRQSQYINKKFINPFSKEDIQNSFEQIICYNNQPYNLGSGDCVLGSTIEMVHIPNDIICEVHGKSSLGRLFLIIHATAGLVDPGFKGNITLEIVNHSLYSIQLIPGMPIAQLTFTQLERESSNPYNGKYQNQGHAVPSLFHLNKMP